MDSLDNLYHATSGRFQLTSDGYRPYLTAIPAILFRLRKWWTYQHGETPMLTVCGEMVSGPRVPSVKEMIRLHEIEIGTYQDMDI